MFEQYLDEDGETDNLIKNELENKPENKNPSYETALSLIGPLLYSFQQKHLPYFSDSDQLI